MKAIERSIWMLSLLLLPLMGCADQAVTETDDTAIRAVLNAPGQGQRLAFDLLRPEEKAALWNRRIQELQPVLLPEGGKREDERRHLITEYASFVTDPKNWIDEPGRSDRLDEFFSSWHDRASAVFPGDLLYQLLFQIADDSETEGQFGDAAGKSDRQCTGCCCSVGSIMTCPKITLAIMDASIEYGECQYSYACSPQDATSSGCGAAWMYSCDGSYCSW
jgi:hypothetical protein